MRLFLLGLTFLISITSIAQPPNAAFTASPLSVCVGQPISFTNQSTAGGSPITSYTWNFGNGETSTFANTTYVYDAPGTYTITLAVQAQNGQADAEVKNNYITVNPLPTALFTAASNGCTVPVGVTFTNQSTTGPGMTYAWNFGNGQNSTLQNPVMVNYNVAGTYTVSLNVSNANTGCAASVNQTIVVSNYTAGITAPTSVCAGEPVTFQDNSTVGANSWSWNAGGGGGTSTAENPTFTFNAAGTYAVTLTSQNTTSGCSGNTVHQITVRPKPTINFTANPVSGCSPLPVTFSNTSSPGTLFKWNFGDGTSFTGQNPPVHSYSGNGSYSVQLVMTGTNGCKDSLTIPNMITLSDPVVQFAANVYNGCSPLAVQFSQTSISPNPISDPIVSWAWNFGDNTTFNGQTPPVHTYQVGVYDVTLTITTQSGCSATLTKNDTIQVGHINSVGFTIDPTIECAKTNIDFTNTSVILAPHTEDEVTYTWNFGDSQNSSEENPQHQYSQDTGYFDVSLIVDFRGCKDTLIITDAVYIKAPISLFSPVTSLVCNPSSFPVNIAVTDNSKIGKISDDVSMIWRWGDNTQTNFDDVDVDDADLGSTSHNYFDYGSYSIKQVIYNTTTGCSDSTTQVVHISRTIANFTVANDSVCKNSVLGLNGSASTSSHTITNWSYEMGNGQTTTGQNAVFYYTQAGTYTITLTATNEVGCSGTATFSPMRVLELPLAQLTANDNAGCAPFLVNFTNSSSVQGNGVPLQSFLWSFSDDNSTQTTTSVGTSVNHTFLTEGNYNVTLVATDVFGCVSSPASAPISLTKPVATFTVKDVVCDNEVFTSVNSSTGFGNLTYQWSIDGTPNVTTQDITNFFDETPSNASPFVAHNLTLITTDENGCKDTATAQIVVSMPVAGIKAIISPGSVNEQGQFLCPPVFVNFEDQSESYGDIVSYMWDFGDNANTSVNENPSNTYVFPGTYSTSLVIIDEYGCNSDSTLVNYLTILGPKGDPSWTQSVSNCGQNIFFVINNLDANVVSLVWDTDDGKITNDSISFSYSYSSIDTFNPTVTLTDANGCSVVYPMDPITINGNGLDAAFTASPLIIDLGGSSVFSDQSTYVTSPITTWTWDFGNGNPVTNLTDADISNAFFTTGNQQVTLTITDQSGCKDQYSLVIFVDVDFDFPNVFTPNGDGKNDLLVIADLFDSFDILIQNRWGNVVSDEKGKKGIILWDGTDKGNAVCTDGIYFYQFTGTLQDGTTQISKKGFVTKLDSK